MNKKVRNLLASAVLGVCLLTLSVVPSFAANVGRLENTAKAENVISSADEVNTENTVSSEDVVSVGDVNAVKENSGFNNLQVISFSDAPDYVKGIKSVSVNKKKWEESSSSLSLMRREAYYRNKEENKLCFDGSSDGMLKSGNILTIESEGYETLYLRVMKATADTFTVKKTDSDTETPSGPSDGINTLHVRMRGSFESALEGQKKYDAISGASTSVTTNKNSDVVVEATVLPDGQEPKESDWKPLSEVITVNKNRTKINIDTAACGMEGVYSIHDSSLSLSGEPLKAGSYPISVTVTDENGRTATSNELVFKVYTRTEILADQLKLENCKQTADGKYMYDMEPWAIASFGGENETVTVPKDIKAWYGSHTSGTYGELGYAVDGKPVQTLIVPAGCNLTLVNMKVFSSVNIVVKNGGKLVLRDSSIHGNIEVENGGKFSSNYDDYGNQFLTGSSINGQLILDDGATLENSSIYSNTNFVSNGHIIRQNTNPVIVVKGKVTVDGQVFVKGDEAATGKDETTGKSLSGQPAICIENGSLNIKKNSVVAAFGGGYLATTSVGGSGIILDNGTISGEGTLIAFGGNGTYDDGADAIRGNGTVSVKNVYAQGGCSSIPKAGSVAGKAIAEGVTLAKTSNRTLLDGKEINDNYGTISELYWSDITKVPDVSKYVIETNGSGKEDSTEPGSSEDKPNTKPGSAEDNSSTKPGTSEDKPNTKPGKSEDNSNTKPATSGKKSETKPASGATNKKIIKTKSLKVKKIKITLKKDKKYKIVAKKIPATSTAKLLYKSSNKKIAKVTKKGVIKALKKGKCKIIVKTSDGRKKIITLKVK